LPETSAICPSPDLFTIVPFTARELFVHVSVISLVLMSRHEETMEGAFICSVETVLLAD